MKKIFILIFTFSINLIYSKEIQVNLLELYKELHANPELSYQEYETSKKLASLLESIGYQVTRNVGGNGVVALLENGDEIGRAHV